MEGQYMKKNIFKIAVAMLLGASLMACGSKADTSDSTASADAKTDVSSQADANAKKIGILQYVQHPALDKANEGFVAALKEAGMNVDIEQEVSSLRHRLLQTNL